MSGRSGYIDDGWEDNWSMICWRGAVTSAIRGQRGQAFLKELVEALDALPAHRLIADELQVGNEYCAIGAVGRKRQVDMSDLNPEDYDLIANRFGIAQAMVREIEYINDDEGWRCTTPEKRWEIVREWAIHHIIPEGKQEI